MHDRPITRFRPGLERLEEKQLLSLSSTTPQLVSSKAGARALASHPVDAQAAPRARISIPNSMVHARQSVSASAVKPNVGFLVYRIGNPNRFNNKLIPPFSQVLVQSPQPVPGQVYNVLYLAVRNGTAQTFDASSGFLVRFPGGHSSFPILTGNQQWKPGQEFVFYVLTKKYYPVPSQVDSGFEFDLGGARSVGIPGPSGIFLRLTYNPATFARTLDWIVAFGPGAQGGKGVKFGLPDTAIYEFVSAKTNRKDFGGYF